MEALEHLVQHDPEALVDRRLLRDPEDPRELVLQRAQAVGLDVRGRQHHAVAAAGDEGVQRRLGGGGAGGRDLGRVAARVAQPVVQRAGLQHLALGGAGALAEQRVDLGQRLLDLLAGGRPVDQRGHLDQLQEAGHGAVHVGGRVQAHLAQLPAHLGDGVQQLVAHDPERGVQALGGAEQLLLHRLLGGRQRGARVLQRRRGTRLARLRPGQHQALARAGRGQGHHAAGALAGVRGARRGAWPARPARRRRRARGRPARRRSARPRTRGRTRARGRRRCPAPARRPRARGPAPPPTPARSRRPRAGSARSRAGSRPARGA